MNEPVLLEAREGALLRLTLNRPTKRNALSAKLRRALVDRLDSADEDPSIGAVLLSAKGEPSVPGST